MTDPHRRTGTPLLNAGAGPMGSSSSLASSSTTTSSKMSAKYYGNITIEMIDDFLNPKTRVNAPEQKLPAAAAVAAKSTGKLLGPSTTQGVGLIEYSDDEDGEPAVAISKGVDPKRHYGVSSASYRAASSKLTSDFDYVSANRHEFETELHTNRIRRNPASASNRHQMSGGESYIAESVVSHCETRSAVGGAMSQIESVTTMSMSESRHAEYKRRAERMTALNRGGGDDASLAAADEQNFLEQDELKDEMEQAEAAVLKDEREMNVENFNELMRKYELRTNYDAKLPITSKRQRILDFIECNQFCIVQGGTGSGKTTQVPQYILDEHVRLGKPCNIIVTQPRRIAAVSVARRVCNERDWQLGGVCGYQIGLDGKNVSDDTRITYVTTGILLQKLIGKDCERNFDKYTHIILDEVHERDLDTDFALLVIKIKSFRNLKSKIVLMSATLQSDLFSDYFKRTMLDCLHKAPVLAVESTPYKVKDLYWEDLTTASSSIMQTLASVTKKFAPETRKYFNLFSDRQAASKSDYRRSVRRTGGHGSRAPDTLSDTGNVDEKAFTSIMRNFECDFDAPSLKEEALLMVLMLLHHFDDIETNQYINAENKVKVKDEMADSRGSVLIFLPGMHEIQTLYELIDKEFNPRWQINLLPLHSDIVLEQQTLVFEKPRPYHRKVILSTSIAESSITVSDIKYVIDFGLTKELYCDPYTNYTHLRLEWASKSSCNQRRGRAGRVSDGTCYRLLSAGFFDKLKAHTDPCILREPLSRVILNVKRLKQTGNPKKVLSLAIQPPKLSDIERNILILKEVGALTLKPKSVRGNDPDDYRYDGDLTFAGSVMANLPIDIRLTKLILLGHTFGKLREAIIIAAGLSTKTFFTCYFKSYLEAFRGKWIWSQGWMCDCIAILNAFNVWESMRERNLFTSRSQRAEWAKKSMIELERLREVEELKRELELRLKSLNINYTQPVVHQHNTNNPSNLHMDDSETAITQNLLLKIIIAGAFYPNYFNGHKLQLNDMTKMVSGRDVRNTVQVKNLPINKGVLYHAKLMDMFRVCSKQMQIHFEDSKAYVEFKSRCEEVASNINLGVYLAVQMRSLRVPMLLKQYKEDVSEAKMRELQRQRQAASSARNTFVKEMSNSMAYGTTTDDDESSVTTLQNDEDQESYDYDREFSQHQDFITGSVASSRSIRTVDSNNNSFSSMSRSSVVSSSMSQLSLGGDNRQRLSSNKNSLTTNRVTVSSNAIVEHLSDPRCHFPPGFESTQQILEIGVSQVIECGHFWCQISDRAHMKTLASIQERLNRKTLPRTSSMSSMSGSDASLATASSSVVCKPLDHKRIYPDALCMTHYKDPETKETSLYRARVLYVSREEISCEVHFVDYGNKATRLFHDLYELDDELKAQPFQAIECKLANVKQSILKNPNGVWSQFSNATFSAKLTDPSFVAWRIRVASIYGNLVMVDLYGYKPVHYNQTELCAYDIGDDLVKSHCAERSKSEDVNRSALLSQSINSSRDILFIPPRESDYMTMRPVATSIDPNLNRKKMFEDRGSRSRRGDPDTEDDAASVKTLESDFPSTGGEDQDQFDGVIELRGPYSPLEISYYAIQNSGQCKKVRTERESINCVTLDDDPLNEATRLLVASTVSLNNTGETMILRKTTLMPKLPGLTALCCLLFSPTVEVRVNARETAFTGALCGLGYDPVTKGAIYPDNDIEIEFDVNIDARDFSMINLVRCAINMVIGSEEDVQSWMEASNLIKLQQKACEKLLAVINRERELIEPVSFRKQYKWNQIPENKIIAAFDGMDEGGFKIDKYYYTFHKIAMLNRPSRFHD